MDRLHKKCAIASAGMHLLLVVILFVGPAFLAPTTKVPDMPLLDFVPIETVDALVSGGGNPQARSPVAQPNVRPEPTPPAAQPAPPTPKQQPEPEPEVKRTPEREPDPTPAPETQEASMTPDKRKKPEVNLKQVTRKPGSSPAEKKAREREEKAFADARRNLVSAIKSAGNAISEGTSGTIEIGLVGPGGGGVPYANFFQAVKSVYTRAWVLPDGAVDDSATVGAEVTIARDGTVVASRIIRRCSSGAVNESVRATLEAVKYAAPLPRDAKEDQRTVTINFNVKAKKQSLG